MTHKVVLMSYHEDSCTLIVYAFEQLNYLVGKLGVDVSRGLVSDNELRVVNKCARDSDTLFFTARKLVRIRICFCMESYKAYNVGNSFSYVFSRCVYNSKNESNVLIDCHRRDKTKILKDKAESTAEFRYLSSLQLVEIIAVDGNNSACGVYLLQQKLDHSTLTRT